MSKLLCRKRLDEKALPMKSKTIKSQSFWFSFLLLCCTTLFALNSHAQNVSASVDRKNVTENETLTLKIRQQGSHNNPKPDLTNLEKNFEVLSNSSTKQYRNINGRAESWVEWNVVIIPKRAGKLLIPSFEMSGEFTTPIEVNVAEAEAVDFSSGQVSDIFIESILDTESAYVQQQILYTIRLGTSLPIPNPGRQDLILDNAKVEFVSEQRYSRRIGNKEYAFLEWVYAIYPQQSGTLDIPKQVWDISTSTRSLFFRNSRNSNVRRLVVGEKSVEVASKPDTYTGNLWLPAKQITLTDSWGDNLDSVKLGEPITRSVIVSADGLTSSQLPELTIEYPTSINQYPEPIKTDEDKSETGILTTLSQSQAIVATLPGQYTLPEVKVTWWNTEKDQQESAVIPEKTVTVIGTAAAPTQQPTALPQDALGAIGQDSNLSVDGGNADTSGTNNLLLIASNVITALIALFFAYLWFTKFNRSTTNDAKPRVLDRSPTPKQALAQFRLVLKTENPQSIRNGLINWSKVKWSTGAHNLDRIKRHLNDPAAIEIIDTLDQSLFSTSAPVVKNFEPLMNELERLCNEEQSDQTPSRLEPLNNIS